MLIALANRLWRQASVDHSEAFEDIVAAEIVVVSVLSDFAPLVCT